MSNPNGSSSVKDVKICMVFTLVNEKGEIEVKEKTAKIFSPVEEYMQLPVMNHIKGEDGSRITENNDVFEMRRNKIVRTTRKQKEQEKEIITMTKKEDKKRA